MADISVSFDSNLGMGEWKLLNGDVAFADSDLLSSVLLMLFTDRTSSDDFIPADGNRRGWWGNSFEEYEIGSRLFQLDRTKFAGNTNPLLLARDYTREALQCFIDQGIARKIDVDVAKINANAIHIQIAMYKPKVPLPEVFKFAFAWAQAGSALNTSL